MPPWTMPKRAFRWPIMFVAGALRPAQGDAHGLGGLSWLAGYGVHSSKIMTMSELRTCWMRIDSSGVRKSRVPSMGDANLTPLRRSSAGRPGKDPEAPGIGEDGFYPQSMKRCSPPWARTTSVPGRSQVEGAAQVRIWAPMSARDWGVIALHCPGRCRRA